MTIGYGGTTHDCGAMGMPEEDGRIGRVSIGVSQSGAVSVRDMGEEKVLTLSLKKKTDTLRGNLWSLLDGNRSVAFTLTPDAHIDFGGGTGVAVTGYWMNQRDPRWAVRDSYNAWDITLVFRKA